jgi:FKBP-type peptidyl-prolyl cis-trans isomerase
MKSCPGFGLSPVLPWGPAIRVRSLGVTVVKCSVERPSEPLPQGPLSPASQVSTVKVTRRHALFAVAALALARQEIAKAAASDPDQTPQVGYVTPSGLRYFDFKVGTGDKPKWGDWVEVDYALYTITPAGDALVMADTTFNRSDRSLILHHGNGEAILGIEEALHSMRQGGRRRVIIPPTMAFSTPGLLPYPLKDGQRRKFFQAMNDTGGTVVADLEILQIMPFPDEHGYYSDPTPSPEELKEIFTKAYQENLAQSQGFPETQ